MAQTGKAMVLTAARMYMVILSPLLLLLIDTGYVILAEFGLDEATS